MIAQDEETERFRPEPIEDDRLLELVYEPGAGTPLAEVDRMRERMSRMEGDLASLRVELRKQARRAAAAGEGPHPAAAAEQSVPPLETTAAAHERGVPPAPPAPPESPEPRGSATTGEAGAAG